LRNNALSLAKSCSMGVEIGTIGRQVKQRGTGALDGGAHGLALVGAEIVHDDDVADRQGGDEELLDIGLERQPVDRAVDHAGGGDGVAAQGGQEGAGLPPLTPGKVDVEVSRVRAMAAQNLMAVLLTMFAIEQSTNPTK
jgi:hypothetical protein